MGLALVTTIARAAEVAVLKSSDVPTWRPTLDALQRSASGHAIKEYDLAGDRGRGLEILKGLKGRVGIVVAVGPLAAQLAREELPEVPLVFCLVPGPAQAGLAPGGTQTGVSFSLPARNQLAAFRVVYPGANRIGVLYSSATTGRLVEEARQAAAVVRVTLVVKAIASEKDVAPTLRALLGGPEAVDAIWLIPEPLTLGDEARRTILNEALGAGKPTFSFSASIVQEGALFSHGPALASIGEKAGELVNRLARGERNIDVLVPRAELVVNVKSAARLKIVIPPEVLRQARTY